MSSSRKKNNFPRATADASPEPLSVAALSESSVSESQKVTTFGNNANILEKDSKDIESMRQYLDQTVIPALLMGMKEVVKERPSDPLGYMAAFLLKYKEEHADKDTISET